jgi:hypothetical protein
VRFWNYEREFRASILSPRGELCIATVIAKLAHRDAREFVYDAASDLALMPWNLE